MTCNRFFTDQCDECFNWAQSSMRARALDPTAEPPNCHNLLNMLVSNCKYYKGNTTATETEFKVDTCWVCRPEFRVLDFNNNTKWAKCVAEPPTGCKLIANCQTTVCFTNPSGLTTYGCRMCAAGYTGYNFDVVNGSGSLECKKGQVIPACRTIIQTDPDTQICYNCSMNNTVSGNGRACLSFTLDTDCRRLAANDTMCSACYHSYYWDNYKCKLESYLWAKFI